MELDEIVEKAKAENGLSQNEVGVKIGLDKSRMSSILHKRRKMPAESAIELAELTNMKAKAVWEAAKRWGSTAACIGLVTAFFFLSGDVETPFATVAYAGWVSGNTNYGGFDECRPSY